MADKLGVDAALAVERLLEREDDQHAADVLLHQLDAVFLPGPQLRTDEENYRHAEAVELFGEPEVDLGEVGEDGCVRPTLADGPLELAEFAVDAWQVAHDFGESHDGHVFRADDAFEAGGCHALAAHAVELSVWKPAAKSRNQQRAVVFAAGFAGRDEQGGGHLRWRFCAAYDHSGSV